MCHALFLVFGENPFWSLIIYYWHLLTIPVTNVYQIILKGYLGVISSLIACFNYLLPPNQDERISLLVTTFLAIVVFVLVVLEMVPEESDSVPLFCKLCTSITTPPYNHQITKLKTYKCKIFSMRNNWLSSFPRQPKLLAESHSENLKRLGEANFRVGFPKGNPLFFVMSHWRWSYGVLLENSALLLYNSLISTKANVDYLISGERGVKYLWDIKWKM